MPLTVPYFFEMWSEMLDRYDVRATEVRLRPDDVARLRMEHHHQDLYDLPIRLADLPPNTVEFFAPEFRRHIALDDWDRFGHLPGTLSFDAWNGVRETTYTPPTERSFTFNGETFHCRVTVEPTPAEPRIRLPSVPSIEPQLRAISTALETQVMSHVNLAAEAIRRLSIAVQDRIANDIVTGYDPRYSMGGPPPKPKPQNRIDFLLEALDDGVEEPHAED